MRLLDNYLNNNILVLYDIKRVRLASETNATILYTPCSLAGSLYRLVLDLSVNSYDNLNADAMSAATRAALWLTQRRAVQRTTEPMLRQIYIHVI